jgi:hypothetical protein
VRECDLARRLVHYAIQNHSLPKHVEPRLVMLRDARLLSYGAEGLARLAGEIKDTSYRIFAEDGLLHVISSGLHLTGADPFDLFEKMERLAKRPLEPSHAFYLGYEMAKAATALTLRKNYCQDQALDWGLLTAQEQSHRQKLAERKAAENAAEKSTTTRDAGGDPA